MALLMQHLRTAAITLQGKQVTREEKCRVQSPMSKAGPGMKVASVAEPGLHQMNGVSISAFENFMFEAFGKDSAVIPVGAFVTTLILGSGLFSLQQKNRVNQQYFMRARVIAQGVTIAAMMTSLAVQERQKALGIIPMYRDGSYKTETPKP